MIEERDILFAALAILGLGLAAWRSRTAWLQAHIAEQNLLNRQFQSSVEMLGHESMTVRLGGITSLTEMALRNPEQYHVRVMMIFVAFLAYPPKYKGGINRGRIAFDSNDIIEIIKAIESSSSLQRKVEREQGFDLEDALKGTAFPIIDGNIMPQLGMVLPDDGISLPPPPPGP